MVSDVDVTYVIRCSRLRFCMLRADKHQIPQIKAEMQFLYES